MARWLKRTAIVLVLLLLGTAAVGYIFQERYDSRILRENPPPGEFVDVGGHRLHYRLFGEGPVTFVIHQDRAEVVLGAARELVERITAGEGDVDVGRASPRDTEEA